MIQESSTNAGGGPVVLISQDTPVTDSGIEESSSLMMQPNQLLGMEQIYQNYLSSPHSQQMDMIFQHSSSNKMDQLLGNTANYYVTFDDCAAAESSNTSQSNPDTTMTDVASTSNEPILVDNGHNVECILPNDEPFTYLHGLNSDNLMQFSQQSAIQELMLKEIKPNLDVLPTFEEHDFGGYNFLLNLSTKRKGRTSWIYSESLHKIYLKMNDIFSIDAVYTPKTPLQQLRIRILMCFVKEVSEPVLRCQNHISKDPESRPKLRHSLLRCENPSAEYCGSAEGKSMNDRYSVVIPLGVGVTPQDDKSIKQTIALKFTCQNSCIGRKETSLIFLLEGMNGEILSQRVLDVKICSCPKRDQNMDERNTVTTPNKRKIEEDLFPCQSKVRKQEPSSPGRVKPERSSSDLEESGEDCNRQKKYDVQRTAGGGFRIVMEMSTKDAMLDVVNYATSLVANKIVSEPNLAPRYSRNYRNYRRLQRLYEKGRKL